MKFTKNEIVKEAGEEHKDALVAAGWDVVQDKQELSVKEKPVKRSNKRKK